jgi:hypothetical protein
VDDYGGAVAGAARVRRGRGGGRAAEPGRPPPVLGSGAGADGAQHAGLRDGRVLRGAGRARPPPPVARVRRGGDLRRRQRHLPAQRLRIVNLSLFAAACCFNSGEMD